MKWIDEILRPKACMILSFFIVIIDFSAVFEGNIWFNTLHASLFSAYHSKYKCFLSLCIFYPFYWLHLLLAPCDYYIIRFMKLMDCCIHKLLYASCDLFETLKTNILQYEIITASALAAFGNWPCPWAAARHVCMLCVCVHSRLYWFDLQPYFWAKQGPSDIKTFYVFIN